MPKADLNYKLLESILAELNHLWIHPNRLVSVACRPITGGYGTVTVAKLHGVMDPATGSDFLVAVKTLRPRGNHHNRSLVAFSLARELKVWQSLEHPNILYLFGFYLSEDKTEARLISPYIELGHIKGFIHDKNPDLAKCVDLALDVASGLDYLHTLKPPICHGCGSRDDRGRRARSTLDFHLQPHQTPTTQHEPDDYDLLSVEGGI